MKKPAMILAGVLAAAPYSTSAATAPPHSCGPATGGLFSRLFGQGSSSSVPQEGSLMKTAAAGTAANPEVKAAGMLPRGSALITSSGDLEKKEGIRHIIHAASGSMTRGGGPFEPSLQGVTDSVRNSLALAKANGHARVALPFIGGKIFVDRIGISAQELADQIVAQAVKSRDGLEVRFVTFGNEDTELFQRAVAKHANGLPAGAVEVKSGSIVDGKLHGATAIVNAANMEVQFGGGLSGVIGRATGNVQAIDAEAQRAIREFYEPK